MAVTSDGYPPKSARLAWCFFDWAAQPVFTLITTFVFAPYFIALYVSRAGVDTQVMRDAAASSWGFMTGAAGLLLAFGAPLLGAIADESGRRKPWTFAFALFSAAGAASLWWAEPGTQHGVMIGLLGAFVAIVGAEFATLFNNAMMPSLAPRERMGRLSGTGWALGYISALIGLALMLALFMTTEHQPGARTFAGLDPLAVFGLDPVAYEGERLSGPFSALWFLVFLLPMLLLTPDIPKAKPFGVAIRNGLSELKSHILALRNKPSLARFFIANLFYQDALGAVFAFGGLFGAAVFGWGATEAGVLGIIIITAGIFGAVFGGVLDDLLGSKIVIAGSILLMLVALFGILSIGQNSILFSIPVVGIVEGDGLFAATTERFYLLCGILIGLVAGPMQAASRSLLTRLSSDEEIGRNFGLFTLAGKATAFLGPTLMALVISAGYGTQAAAWPIAVLFLLGFVFLLSVRTRQ
jgi:MFS transporter, UMF1 family